jgi:O-antigen ligase
MMCGKGSELRSTISLLVLIWTAVMLFLPLPGATSVVSDMMTWSSGQVTTPFPLLEKLAVGAICLLSVIGAAIACGRHITPLFFCSLVTLCDILAKSNTVICIAPLFAWSIFFWATQLKQSDRIIAINIYMAGLAICVVTSIGWYFCAQHQFLTPGFGRRAGGIYSSPNSIYPVAIIALFLSLERAKPVSISRYSLLYYIFSFASITLLILTFSRSGWVGTAVALPIASWRRTRIPNILLACFCASLFVGAALIRTGGQLPGGVGDGSVSNRPYIWHDAYELWKGRPLFGYGYGGYARHVLARFDAGNSPFGQLPDEPKNLLLAVLVDGGIVGLTSYCVLIASAMKLASQIGSEAYAHLEDACVARSVVPITIALLVAGLVDTPVFESTDRLPSTILLLMIYGLMASTLRDLSKYRPICLNSTTSNLGEEGPNYC